MALIERGMVMNIHITDEALVWFEEEMGCLPGDYIQFFVRYGGDSKVHPGFSLGIKKAAPYELGMEVIKDNIHFYFEARDEWYFKDYTLTVGFDPQLEEITYQYE